MINKLDFIGIGVQKAATTWVASCLSEHPKIRFSNADVVPSRNKEIHFFSEDDKFHQGLSWYHRGFEFGEWKNGEFSTYYFSDPRVPSRIHAYNPNIRLLLVLRNPVERAFSQHLHEIMGGNLARENFDFESALSKRADYVLQGMYATHLKSFLQFFSLDQIHVVLYDEIQSNPKVVISELFGFLDVDNCFAPSSLESMVNKSCSYRYPELNQFVKYSSRFIRSLAGDRTAEFVKSVGLVKVIEKMNNLEKGDSSITPVLEEALRKKIFLKYFKSEMHELEAILSLDLQHWFE